MIANAPLVAPGPPDGGASEARRSWRLVFAGMAGMSISGMVPYSLGLFMDPLAKAFGWSRGLVSVGPTVIAGFAILLTPFVGGLTDRFGPRAIAVPGLILTSLAFAALGLASASSLIWVGLWSLYAIVFTAVKPLVWSAAVSRSFDRGRGLALAVTLSGVAISQTLTPIIAEWLIRTQGWRQAFAWLGLGWGGVVLLIVIPLFREPAVAAPPRADHGHAAGFSLRGIVDANIAKIAIASFLLATIGAGVVVHKVPILGAFGVDRVTAARLAATAGVAGILGKLATGWLMDRFKGHTTGAVGMGITGLGVAFLLAPGHPYAMIVAAMLLLGFGAGAALQVSMYLVSRFAAVDSYGRAFGAVSVMTAIGAGLGPWLFGVAYAMFNGYGPVLVASVPVCLIGGVLIAMLEPLPALAR